MRGVTRKTLYIIGVIVITGALTLILWHLGFWNKLVGAIDPKYEDLVIGGIFSIMSTLIAIGSLLTGISSTHSTLLGNVREYYDKIESKEIYDARHLLYKYRDYRNIKDGVLPPAAESSKNTSSNTKANSNNGSLPFSREPKENVSCNTEPLKSDFDSNFKEYALANGLKCDKYTMDAEGIREAAYHVANFYQMWGLLQDKGFLPIWVFKTSAGFNLIRLYLAIKDVVDEKRVNNNLYAEEFEKLCKRVSKKYRSELRKCYINSITKDNKLDTKIYEKEKALIESWLGKIDIASYQEKTKRAESSNKSKENERSENKRKLKGVMKEARRFFDQKNIKDHPKDKKGERKGKQKTNKK